MRKKSVRPYVLLFEVRTDHVLILRIAHERSDWASLVLSSAHHLRFNPDRIPHNIERALLGLGQDPPDILAQHPERN